MAKESLTVIDNRSGRRFEVPIENGAIRATDLQQIRVTPEEPGLVSYDPAFMNTASCKSRITYIDGDKGVLLYRGYPIEQLAAKSTFMETAYLLLFGELPTPTEFATWNEEVLRHRRLPANVKAILEGFHDDAHAMGVFLSTVGALS